MRNQCLAQRPAIARLSARIADLEEEGYVFDAKWIGRDYVYKVVSINGVPFAKSARAITPIVFCASFAP